MKSARKRMERNVPKVVGPWLAGTFDRDRAVSKAANDGLSSFLTTPEKVLQFWRRCQQQILNYAIDAVNETAETLSDRRSTNSDDADAKYFRVLSGGLALALNLLQKLGSADIEKSVDQYDQFFEHDIVWGSALVNDSTVRKLSSQLLSICIERRPDRIEADLPRISKVFVVEGLKSNQAGSATDFIDALIRVTKRYPTVWTSDHKSKKSPVSRLKLFFESGSQGSAPHYWTKLTELTSIIPSGVLPQDTDGAIELLTSMRKGLSNRDEPRTNLVEAWSSYLSLARQFLQSASSSEARLKFSEHAIFPLTNNYLFPVPEASAWSSGNQLQVLIRAYTSTTTLPFEDLVEATKAEWRRLKDELQDRVRNSLPEASKEHQKSQKSVADAGERWFSLTGTILDAHEKTVAGDRPIPDIPAPLSLELLEEGIKLLSTRNWKPFGVAMILESAIKSAPLLFSRTPTASSLLDELKDHIMNSRETFLKSSSVPYILSSIILLGRIPQQQSRFESLWDSSVSIVMESLDHAEAIPALSKLISSTEAAAMAQRKPGLQTELIRRCLMCGAGSPGASWDLFNNVLTFGVLNESALDRLVRELASRIKSSTGEPNEGVMRGLQIIAEKRPDLLIRDEDVHMGLMTSLLSLSEKGRGPEVATLQALLGNRPKEDSTIDLLIQQNINNASPASLSYVSSTSTTAVSSDLRPGWIPSFNKRYRHKRLSEFLPNREIAAKEYLLFCQISKRGDMSYQCFCSMHQTLL